MPKSKKTNLPHPQVTSATRTIDRAYVSAAVRRDLWVAAAGRCEFRGCGKPVDRDFLTKARCKVGEYAHIIADSPAGARGVPGESERLALSFGELHQWTLHLKGDDAFLSAFHRVFDHGVETGIFPQLRVIPASL